MIIPYEQGLHPLGNGIYAYLQPDGTWGWSNAGLIVDHEGASQGNPESGQSLLVDTLFDLALTRRMLDDMRRATRAAETIDVVVNTHANGDHCWGNQLVAGARIIASRAAAAEMPEVPPQLLAQLVRSAPSMGPLGAYISAIFGSFAFDDITLTLPTETFEGQLTLRVGSRAVELIEVGPAHTRGDILVYVPAERVVFTGDIVFHEIHPVIWAGPIDRWIAACERILGMDVDVVVPGHGPVTDKHGVQRMRNYLVHVRDAARGRYQAGMSLDEAVRDIALDEFQGWGDPERLVVNVASVYRQLGAADVPADIMALFGKMSALARGK